MLKTRARSINLSEMLMYAGSCMGRDYLSQKSKSPMVFCYRVLCISRISGMTQNNASCLQHKLRAKRQNTNLVAPRGDTGFGQPRHTPSVPGLGDNAHQSLRRLRASQCKNMWHSYICCDGKRRLSISIRQNLVICLLKSMPVPVAKLHQSARRRMLHYTCFYF